MLLAIVILPFPTSLLAEFGFTEAAAPAVVLYSVVNLLANIGWLFVIRVALEPRPLTKSETARASMEHINRQSKIAFFIYLACVLLAFWFPLAIAVTLAIIWIIWLVLGLNELKMKQ